MRTEHYLVTSAVDDLDEAITFLTGGKVKKWKEQFLAARLTSLYSVLHKIAIFNWVPSKNSTVVTRPQAQLLYRLGRGIHFNFGQMVFDIVTRFARGDAEFFTLRNQYLKGDHIVALPWINARDQPTIGDVGTSVGNTGPDKVQFSIADIQAHISRLRAQNDQIQEMIDALETSLLSSGQGGESANADEDEDDAEEDVADDVVNTDDNITESNSETEEETEEAAAMRVRKGKRVAEEETTTRRSLRRRRN
ncbi:hypothetical protein CASFOL_040018 [Castilleja foliolosa]|uniref:Uncharacterized protein n=1 Tax=Castilleja foliolosa TaxID=1961234 RepID=A0ABD3BFX5_9LAMI